MKTNRKLTQYHERIQKDSSCWEKRKKKTNILHSAICKQHYLYFIVYGKCDLCIKPIPCNMVTVTMFVSYLFDCFCVRFTLDGTKKCQKRSDIMEITLLKGNAYSMLFDREAKSNNNFHQFTLNCNSEAFVWMHLLCRDAKLSRRQNSTSLFSWFISKSAP